MTETVERRAPSEMPAVEKPPTSQWSLLTNLADLIHSDHHSVDFSGSRADYIHNRVRVLGLIYAALVILWIPIDALLVPSGMLTALAITRAVACMAFLAVALVRHNPHHLPLALFRLSLLVVIPCVFFFITQLILVDGVSEWAAMGYGFYPYVMIAQLAIFALTLLEGLALAIPVFLIVLATAAIKGTFFTADTVACVWLLGLLLSLALWAQMSQLQMLLRLYRQATRDPLTGLFNRRALMGRLDEEMERSERYKRKLTVLLFDLDKFKRVNDTLGHLAGDAVLRHFAKVVEAALRRSDLVGRYGGEECLAVLPETTPERGCEVAERIRADCHAAPAITSDGIEVRFTTSIGVATLLPGEDSEGLIGRCDDSLYKAKETGRDRVVLAD
ncbi:MAG: GGDEF domain-containing protein [Gammaproteobacteria bacterium]|nr:MAG: GGDEF domain-containing protein [Gammaproteobacteria bacterium]